MAISDLSDLAELVDFVRAWRFFVPAAIGAGAGLWIFISFGDSTSSLAAAIVWGMGGIATGLYWQIRHEMRQEKAS